MKLKSKEEGGLSPLGEMGKRIASLVESRLEDMDLTFGIERELWLFKPLGRALIGGVYIILLTPLYIPGVFWLSLLTGVVQGWLFLMVAMWMFFPTLTGIAILFDLTTFFLGLPLEFFGRGKK